MYGYAMTRMFFHIRALGVAIFFLTAGLWGCSTSTVRANASPDALAGSSVALKMEGANGGDASMLFASFPLVQGGVTGSVTTPSVMMIQSTPDSLVRLPMDELGRRVRAFAKPLRQDLIEAGLSAAPQDLQIARVGTYIYDNNLELMKGAGLRDSKAAEDSLALIYVDRPGAIKGTMSIQQPQSADAILFVFDLKMPAAGMHWVRIRTLDSKHSELVIDDAPGLPVLSEH